MLAKIIAASDCVRTGEKKIQVEHLIRIILDVSTTLSATMSATLREALHLDLFTRALLTIPKTSSSSLSPRSVPYLYIVE
jgi:hypothetical protein